jgi:hypothetical protein
MLFLLDTRLLLELLTYFLGSLSPHLGSLNGKSIYGTFSRG